MRSHHWLTESVNLSESTQGVFLGYVRDLKFFMKKTFKYTNLRTLIFFALGTNFRFLKLFFIRFTTLHLRNYMQTKSLKKIIKAFWTNHLIWISKILLYKRKFGRTSPTVILDGPKLRSTNVILNGQKLCFTTVLLDNLKIQTLILDSPIGRWSKFTDICSPFAQYKKIWSKITVNNCIFGQSKIMVASYVPQPYFWTVQNYVPRL